MLQGKGVRFDGVLDLTFDIEGQPMYKLERDQNVIPKTFGRAHRCGARRTISYLEMGRPYSPHYLSKVWANAQ